jgi:hypothetical protein
MNDLFSKNVELKTQQLADSISLSSLDFLPETCTLNFTITVEVEGVIKHVLRHVETKHPDLEKQIITITPEH